jgi:hypothetical protein
MILGGNIISNPAFKKALLIGRFPANSQNEALEDQAGGRVKNAQG